jgi:hypothetical protein
MLFFDIVAADTDTLFAKLYPLPKGSSELVPSDLTDNPISGLLKGPLGQGEASQLELHLWIQEKVRWGEIRQLGRVANRLDLLRHQ